MYFHRSALSCIDPEMFAVDDVKHCCLENKFSHKITDANNSTLKKMKGKLETGLTSTGKFCFQN